MRILWVVDDSRAENVVDRRMALLKDHADAELSILAIDSRVARALKDKAIPRRTLADYGSSPDRPYKDAEAGLRLLETIGNLCLPAGLTVRSLSSHRGISVWDLHSVDLLLYGFERIMRQLDFARRVLDHEKPELLVCDASGNPIIALGGIQFDRLLVRLLTASAAGRSIPTAGGGWKLSWAGGVVAILLPLLSVGKTLFQRFLLLGRTRSCRAGGPVEILAINHTARNAEGLVPVLEVIRGDGRWKSIVVQIGPQGEDSLGKAQLPYVRWEKYLTVVGLVRSVLAIATLFRKWRDLRHAVRSSGALRDAFRDGEVDLWEVSEEILEFLWMTLGQGVRNIEIAHRVVEVLRPRLTVGTNERSGTYRLFYGVGKRQGIPSLSISCELIDPHPIYRIPIGTDVMAVEGRAAVDAIAQAGGATSTLRVTGRPRYDRLLERSAAGPREAVFQEFGIPNQSKLVVYASHAIREIRFKREKVLGPEDAAYTREMQAIYLAIREMPGCFLIVKPHPWNDDPSLPKQIQSQLGLNNIAIVNPSSDVDRFVLASDVVITRWSTVGLDALVLGKPLVIVNFTERPDPFPFVASGAAIGAYSETDVRPSIQKALYDAPDCARMSGGRRRFLDYFTLSMDRSSARRVVELIDDMLERRGPQLGNR